MQWSNPCFSQSKHTKYKQPRVTLDTWCPALEPNKWAPSTQQWVDNSLLKGLQQFGNLTNPQISLTHILFSHGKIQKHGLPQQDYFFINYIPQTPHYSAQTPYRCSEQERTISANLLNKLRRRKWTRTRRNESKISFSLWYSDHKHFFSLFFLSFFLSFSHFFFSLFLQIQCGI